jgi:hypothetical protein
MWSPFFLKVYYRELKGMFQTPSGGPISFLANCSRVLEAMSCAILSSNQATDVGLFWRM